MGTKITGTTKDYLQQTAYEVWKEGHDAFEYLGRDRFYAEELNGAPVAPTPVGFNLDDYVGYTFRGKPILDQAGVINQIDSGTQMQINNGVITYTFLDKNHLVGLFNNPTIGFTAEYNISPFSARQAAEARQSVQFWDDLIPQTFVEKNGVGADIVFANSWDPAQAYAYYPQQQGWKFQSDVFIADPAVNYTNNWLSFGGYGATTLIHELGHTLGLSHPGNYNYDPNLPLSYANYAEYAQDSVQYSIMSYWDETDTGGYTRNWSTLQFNNPQTPMLHDILTIQAKYGVDTTTRATDTVYGFGSTAGRDVFDFAANKWPFLAIYDAGGSDTVNLSGFTASQFLDLHDGSFSSVGDAIPDAAGVAAGRAALAAELGITLGPRSQAQIDALANQMYAYSSASIAADTGVTGIVTTQYNNFAIAYGTIIENAVGGSARDLIWGNEVANSIDGGAGDDVIDGYEGADTLTGGAGADTFMFHVIEGGDTITDFVSGSDKIDLTGTGVDFTWIGNAAFSGAAGQLRFAGGVLEGDVNGDGIADLSITVGGNAPLVTDLLFA